ncbi:MULTISPECIES: endolytic transglycosylase MltG [Bacillus]|uniref:endolytic transglycosylase MltG n=1 Tax=Bacillus TaxID=1386 RepID=UPI000BB8088B|nr:MULTISPECIES: endolytic transglycosylase MltG [Bacillus]
MKTTFRALAVGILFATGVTGCAYTIEGKKEVALTEEQIQSYVAENNLFLLTKEEYDSLLPSMEEEKVEEQEAEVAEESPKDSEEPKEEEKVEEEPKVYTFEIKSGVPTQIAAEQLESDGLIESAKDFIKFLGDAGLEKKVRAGTYEIQTGMSYREIAEIITR